MLCWLRCFCRAVKCIKLMVAEKNTDATGSYLRWGFENMRKSRHRYWVDPGLCIRKFQVDWFIMEYKFKVKVHPPPATVESPVKVAGPQRGVKRTAETPCEELRKAARVLEPSCGCAMLWLCLRILVVLLACGRCAGVLRETLVNLAPVFSLRTMCPN